MSDFSKFKISIENEKKVSLGMAQQSNPLSERAENHQNAICDYSQTLPRQQYDKDIAEIVEIVRILNNLAPIKMPEYNFNIDEINGERYYKPDGSLLLIREYDNDLVRDYYVAKEKDGSNNKIDRILEHDKMSGRLRTKIEPITRQNSRLKTNITIFDSKINNKYTIIQLSEGGYVNNISEFTGKGNSFQTMFRNVETFKPVRYLEGRDNNGKNFEMIDCLFDAEGKIVRIKRFTDKKEVNIEYTENTKNISVKNKS